MMIRSNVFSGIRYYLLSRTSRNPKKILFHVMFCLSLQSPIANNSFFRSAKMTFLFLQGGNQVRKAILPRPFKVFVPPQFPLPIVRMRPSRKDQRLRNFFDRMIVSFFPRGFQVPEYFMPFFGSRTNEFPHIAPPYL